MILGDRKTGCRFYEFTFYGFRSLLIENDKIRTVLLLDKGTDIISFVDKKTDTEFVWTNPMGLSCLEKIKKGHMDEDCLSDNYVGGWFEILPNLGGPCVFKNKHFPGHGEVSNLPWDYQVVYDSEEEIQLLFFTRLSKYPLELRKKLCLKKGDSSLCFEEEIHNIGVVPCAYTWAHHPNIGYPFLNEKCVIEAPFLSENISVPAQGTMVNEVKTYENVCEGSAVIRNTDTGVGIRFEWDKETFRHCNLWISAGYNCGHHHHDGAYVVCILPSSSKVMDLDKAYEANETYCIEGKDIKKSFFRVSII